MMFGAEMASVALPPRPVVLIVEDEPLLRFNAIDIVEQAGFEAVEAGDADEARRILEQRTDIRIVFTDINLPGSMNGLKLAATVRHRWPPIELIITSGMRRPDAADIPERGLFFAKPYSAGKIAAALHSFIPAE
jgi:DNA-binding NtrC family response regulator